ncbi:hypothetical protein [Streptosporangium sp. 'caverna']|uniref:hypothetical protein n=1 Tax=Streptosporangium sp. 'caverna' TaxID=2202249 RepID=UPI0013A6B97B|nr:hypothetical protein [Streptosporangium sp. 'caverna']
MTEPAGKQKMLILSGGHTGRLAGMVGDRVSDGTVLGRERRSPGSHRRSRPRTPAYREEIRHAA